MSTLKTWGVKLGRAVVAGGILVALAGGPIRSVSSAGSPPQVRINPASLQVYTGYSATSRIEIDPTSLSAISLTLTFDPHLIAVVDADPDAEGIQIEPGPSLQESGAVVTVNQADNTDGRIEFEVTGLPLTPVVDQLASITWLGLAEGVAEVTPTDVQITDPTGQIVTPNTQNSIIQVMAVQPRSLFGRVLLQGRRQHNGGEVYVSTQACPEATNKTLRSGNPIVSTNTDGYFEIVPPEGATYRCLQVFQRGYLLGQAADPAGDLGTITLPGGDINGDDVINIFDMAFIGSHYGDNDPQIDINGDGIVSIFDLVLAASNYGRQGPVTRWQ